MNTEYSQEYIDNLNGFLADVLISDAEKIKYGIVPNMCKAMMTNILIHCFENVDLFNNTQMSNINYMLNSM